MTVHFTSAYGPLSTLYCSAVSGTSGVVSQLLNNLPDASNDILCRVSMTAIAWVSPAYNVGVVQSQNFFRKIIRMDDPVKS